jgi:hypothetical protein
MVFADSPNQKTDKNRLGPVATGLSAGFFAA